jgi:hypothetical protein
MDGDHIVNFDKSGMEVVTIEDAHSEIGYGIQ